MVALGGTLLYIKSVQQSMTFSMDGPGGTCIFPKRVTYVFFDSAFLNQCLIFL